MKPMPRLLYKGVKSGLPGAEYYNFYYNLEENGYKRLQVFPAQKEKELS